MTNVQIDVTGSREVFPALPETQRSAQLVDRSDVLHRRVRNLHEDSAQVRRDALMYDLEARQHDVAAKGGAVLLGRAGEAGLAWRDVARIVGVTVPAVQKWRKGEGISGPKRLTLARLVALMDVLEANFIHEPASWLEMPIRDGVGLSRLDLLAAGRFDLVLLLIADDAVPVEIDQVLDEYDSEWRSRYVDDAFESFIAADGNMSIRSR